MSYLLNLISNYQQLDYAQSLSIIVYVLGGGGGGAKVREFCINNMISVRLPRSRTMARIFLTDSAGFESLLSGERLQLRFGQ